MAYVALKIDSGDPRFDALIRETIERYLIEVHYLLAAVRLSSGPDGHYPYSCTIMMLATVAATAALRHPQRIWTGKGRNNDKVHFVECVNQCFPWDHVKVTDDQFRKDVEVRAIAATILYETFRCPLIHSAGIVGRSESRPRVVKIHPGHQDVVEAGKRVETLARASTLAGQIVLELQWQRCTLHVDSLYWCVRKLVERFAADPENVERVLEHLSSGMPR